MARKPKITLDSPVSDLVPEPPPNPPITRARALLDCLGVRTIGELCALNRSDLLRPRNAGKKTVGLIAKRLDAHGFKHMLAPGSYARRPGKPHCPTCSCPGRHASA